MAASNAQQEKEKTFDVKFQDVVLDAKYNPALFIPTSKLGMDSFCQSMINRGMESVEVRKLIQRDLVDGKSRRCSQMFEDRNMKSNAFKLSKLETCSYCGKENCEQSDLWVYFTIAHAEDLVIQEILKRNDEKTKDSCVFKHVTIANLETKIRDVRSPDPFIVNRECVLLCLTRCDDCMDL